MIKKLLISKYGFTLFETLIAVAVTSLVGVLLLVIIVNSTGVSYKQSAEVEQGVDSNDALSMVKAEIKQASAVVSTYTAPDSTVYTSGSTQLVLKISSIDNKENIIPDVYDYFVFLLDQNRLKLKTFPDVSSKRKSQNQILASNVSSLLFKYYDNSVPLHEVNPQQSLKVKVVLALKQKAGTVTQEITTTTEANLRND